MTEIIFTIMILFSSLAVRDALVYECQRHTCIRELSPWKFAIAAAGISVLAIWIFSVPVKKYYTGVADNSPAMYDKIVSFIISVSFLISALSLREASSNCFEESKIGRWTPWVWSLLVVASTAFLIHSVVSVK